VPSTDDFDPVQGFSMPSSIGAASYRRTSNAFTGLTNTTYFTNVVVQEDGEEEKTITTNHSPVAESECVVLVAPLWDGSTNLPTASASVNTRLDPPPYHINPPTSFGSSWTESVTNLVPVLGTTNFVEDVTTITNAPGSWKGFGLDLHAGPGIKTYDTYLILSGAVSWDFLYD
jgi:hypothetical protein